MFKNYNPIIIVAGEPNSVFLELYFKVLKKKIKNPLIIIVSEKILLKQSLYLKQKIKIKKIKLDKIKFKEINNKQINFINVEYNQANHFKKSQQNQKIYRKMLKWIKNFEKP